MTNDEINHRVAEIEGWRFIKSESARLAKWAWPGCPPQMNMRALDDNPPQFATDWRWCGPLIEKYNLNLECWVELDDPPTVVENWCAGWDSKPGHFRTGQTPQMAICLAVIAIASSRVAA